MLALDAIVVLGSIMPLAGPAQRSMVPGRATAVDGAELLFWRPDVLTEALARQPGFTVYDDLGSGYKPTLLSRGFAVSPVVGLPQGLTVFVDGVAVNEPAAGEVNFDVLPLEFAERVELLGGTVPLLGPNTLGGAINLVTKRGESPDARALELAAGSFGSFGVTAGWGDVTHGVDWFAGATIDRSDGWRQLTASERYHMLASVGRDWARTGGRIVVSFGSAYAETAGSLPLSVYTVAPDSNLTSGDFEDLRQLHVAFTGYHRMGASGVVGARLHFRDGAAERFNVNQALDPDVRAFTDSRSAGAELDWRTAIDLAGGAATVRFGAAAALSDTRVRIHAERIDPGITTDVSSPGRDLGVFGEARYTRGRVWLTGAARWDAVRVPYENRLDPDEDTTSTFVRLSPRVGVELDAGRGARVYGSLSQGFRAPALIELACADPGEPCPLPFALGDDPPLDPVVVTTAELGAAVRAGWLSVALALYRSEVEDDIFLLPYEEEGEPEGSTIDGYFDNVDRTRRDGAELSAALEAERWRARIGGAWTNATFRTPGIEIFSIREESGAENEVSVGDRIPLIPEWSAMAALDVDVTSALEAGAALKWVGERHLRGDESNDEAPLDDYAALDVRALLAVTEWEIEGVV